MKLLDNIRKSISNLPGLRRPHQDSLYEMFIDQYGWSFGTADKSLGDLQVYYNALNNVYVKQCIQVYCDESLNNGFQIVDKEKDTVDFSHVNYLTNLFNDPQGKNEEDTFAMLNTQIWTSWLLTGDCFVEVNHESEYGNIPVGFKFIPTEMIGWFEDTNQWGLRNTGYRYEKDELIHIYQPRVSQKNYLWGISVIDSIGLSIALEFMGLKHNKEIFENSGIDPRGILSFDKEASQVSVNANLQRLKQEKAKKGIIAIQGATYQSTNNTNRDMDFMNLMNYARDRIITAFGVQPSKVGVRETASLGSGTGESQDKDFSKTLAGKCKTIEDAFNKVLGRAGFSEVFEYIRMDTENKQLKAQIEDLQIKNGTRYINEVRKDYGLEPVPWGNTPMNYGMFGVTNNPEDTEEVIPIGEHQKELETYQKALLYERLKDEYDYY